MDIGWTIMARIGMNTDQEKIKNQMYRAAWRRVRFGFMLMLIGFFVLIGGSVLSLLLVDHNDFRYVFAGTRLLFGLFGIAGSVVLARRLLQIGRPAVYDPATMLRADGYFMEKGDAAGASVRGPDYLRIAGYFAIGCAVLLIPMTGVLVYFALQTYELPTYE